MKIIHLTTFLDFGGIERKKENLSFWNDDNEWVYVAINKGGAAESKIQQNGKRVDTLNLPYKIPSVSTIYHLYQFLKKEAPDVIHTSGAEANFHGVIAGKLANVPIIVCEDWGSDTQSKTANLIFKYIFKLANSVIGESGMVVKSLKQKYNLSQSKVAKIYNFIDIPSEKKVFKQSQSELTIISVARLVEKKRIEVSLRVIAKLIKNGYNLKFLILGDGPLLESLKNYAMELDIEDQVEFLGFITDPLTYLKNADVYLSTSNNEGFSNSLLEAMAMRLVSVTTLVGGVEDIIVNGKNGFITSIIDEENIYQNLKTVLDLPESERKKIGDNSFETVKTGFSLEGHIQSLMKIYKNNNA